MSTRNLFHQLYGHRLLAIASRVVSRYFMGMCSVRTLKRYYEMRIPSLIFTTILLAWGNPALSASGQEPTLRTHNVDSAYTVVQTPQTIHTHEPGRPLVTSMEISCGLSPEEIRSVLDSLDLYDTWVIRALNDRYALQANPMCAFEAVLADHASQVLTLLFDFQRPFRIEGVSIPFTYCTKADPDDPSRHVVEIMLKSPNIAVKDAGLRILYGMLSEEGLCDQTGRSTIRAEIVVDFTGLVDVFLNVPNYTRNTERRLELCVDSLFTLLAEMTSSADAI